MKQLLAELERDRGRTTRRIVGVLGLLGAIALAPVLLPTRDDPCPPADDLLADSWGPQQRDAIARAVEDTGAPYASESWTALSRQIDAFAEDWVRLREDACAAAWVRGDESPELFDRRVACLEERHTALRELGGLLIDVDAERVGNVGELADAMLPSLAPCADATRLLARVPPPADPELAANVTATRAGLVHVRALWLGGDYDEALRESERLCDDAGCDDDDAAYPPIRAEALLRRAEVLAELGRFQDEEPALRAAFDVSLASGHDEVLEHAASQMIPLLALRLDRRTESEHWIEIARAAQIRIDAGAEARSELANHVALVRHATGDYAGAVSELERGLALLDPDDRNMRAIATMENNLCHSLRRLGRLDEAEAACQRSLELRSIALGPNHPETGRTLVGLGNVLNERGDYAGAIEYYERALTLLTAAFGERSPHLLEALVNLGNVADTFGDHARAELALSRALAIQRRELAADHVTLSATLLALGLLDLGRDRRLLARLRFEEALALRQLKLGADDPALAVVLVNLGTLDAKEGRYADADAHLERALRIRERALGSDHPAIAYVLGAIAENRIAAGRPAEAIALSERALSLRERAAVEPMLLARTRFQLARALVAAGRDQPRARSLARTARTEFDGMQLLDEREEIDRWLAAH
jgi:tetratricopeptide (TPR) repeat protein